MTEHNTDKIPVNGILLLYHHYLAPSAATIMQHVESFENNSKFKVWKLNTELGFPRELSRLRFNVIVLHYSLFGFHTYYLDEMFRSYLKKNNHAYKVIFLQDEYQYCQQRFEFLDEFGINCIFTLLEPTEHAKVYGNCHKVERIEYTLAGFVNDELFNLGRLYGKKDADRSIDIGYRGRELPVYMGREAFEKTNIAHEFSHRLIGQNLKTDIFTGEDNRIYGDKWYQFLANCRAVLGVEAGVSIFDLTDEVILEYKRLEKEKGKGNVSYEDFPIELLERTEGKVYYRMISPRHFEAAALGVCQILFEGRYSGILTPGEHYIPLKKDFSNFEKVITQFRDPDVRNRIQDAAYRDLITSKKYTYACFVENFDRVLDEQKVLTSDCDVHPEMISELLTADLFQRMTLIRGRKLMRLQFPGRRLLSRIKNFFNSKKRN